MIKRNQRKPSVGPSELQRPRKVAMYIRVSTEYQVDKDSLPMQRKDLIAYADLILGIQKYEIFEDAGYSGKNTDRPAFQEMMARIRKHEFSHVLVWKIDRISRNLLDFAEMYKEFQINHVTFVSKNEQFDTSTAIGEAMLKIILVFAELERNMTSERVTATMISRASNGLWNGGRIPFGYSYDSEKREFSIVPEEAEICCKLRDRFLDRRSLVDTARYLNEHGFHTRSGIEWSPTAVWVIVSSPFYAGSYRYNRYKGADRRIENPEDEWVIIRGHHPAIFTQEEHEAMLATLNRNARHTNRIGEYHISKNAHVFSGICYCGKCGSRMSSTPGRLHADGFRPSNYSCPRRRNTKDCDNPTVSDMVVGEFVINYILNMLAAKRSFSSIQDPEDLQRRLLFGSTFSGIDHIEQTGLNEYFNLLSRYGSDDSYVFAVKKPRKKKAEVDPQIRELRADKEKQERALQRLQDLYLYSDNALSEKDFILRKAEIISRLDDISKQLGMLDRGPDRSLSDEDFVKQASHLLISRYLKDRTYIYYKNLAKDVSPEILKEYMSTIIDSLAVADGKIKSITFANGLTHRFIWK